MKNKEYLEFLKNEFLSCLKEETLPWKKDWSGRTPFKGFNYKTNIKYKGVNRLLTEIVCQKKGFKTNAFMTMNQIREKDYSLIKGSKGIPIQYWYAYDTKEKKNISWGEYDEKEKEYLKKKEPSPIIITFKVYYIFNAANIEIENGKTLEEEILSQEVKGHKEEDVEVALNVLNTYCDNEKIDIKYGGNLCCYKYISDEILLPERESFNSDGGFIASFSHEVAHSTGHKSRMDRGFTGDYESENYAIEELRAEISSAFLCADFGVPGRDNLLDNSKRYVASWIEGLNEKPDKLIKAINDADRISTFVEEVGRFN